MKKTTKILIPILSLPLFFAVASSAFAMIKQAIEPITPGITSIPQFLKQLLDTIIKMGIPVSAIFIIYSGFLFVTAQGDASKLTKARSAFTWAVIGTALVLGSWLLATAIQGTIANIAGV